MLRAAEAVHRLVLFKLFQLKHLPHLDLRRRRQLLASFLDLDGSAWTFASAAAKVKARAQGIGKGISDPVPQVDVTG